MFGSYGHVKMGLIRGKYSETAKMKLSRIPSDVASISGVFCSQTCPKLIILEPHNVTLGSQISENPPKAAKSNFRFS